MSETIDQKLALAHAVRPVVAGRTPKVESLFLSGGTLHASSAWASNFRIEHLRRNGYIRIITAWPAIEVVDLPLPLRVIAFNQIAISFGEVSFDRLRFALLDAQGLEIVACDVQLGRVARDSISPADGVAIHVGAPRGGSQRLIVSTLASLAVSDVRLDFDVGENHSPFSNIRYVKVRDFNPAYP